MTMVVENLVSVQNDRIALDILYQTLVLGLVFRWSFQSIVLKEDDSTQLFESVLRNVEEMRCRNARSGLFTRTISSTFLCAAGVDMRAQGILSEFR